MTKEESQQKVLFIYYLNLNLFIINYDSGVETPSVEFSVIIWVYSADKR